MVGLNLLMPEHAKIRYGIQRGLKLGLARCSLVNLRRQRQLWIPQIPSVTNAIEISDMRKGTGGWVKKATGK